jgi:hypothetical protein
MQHVGDCWTVPVTGIGHAACSSLLDGPSHWTRLLDKGFLIRAGFLKFPIICLKLLDSVKNSVFWDVKPCGSFKYRCFRRTLCLHHQGDRNRLARNSVVPSSPILVIWWCWRYIPTKRRFLQEPQGVTSQKTEFFIVTAVKTSNLTC